MRSLTFGTIVVSALAWAATGASAGDDALPTVDPLPVTTGVCDAEPPTTATVRDIRVHARERDDDRALQAARRVVAQATTSVRDRDAARFAIGVLQGEAGDDDAAADAFGDVADHEGPLRAFAGAAQAEALLRLGRARAALAACQRVGPSAQETLVARCQRVDALAHAALGSASAARRAAQRHDAAHRGAELAETVERTLAVRASRTDPTGSVDELVALALDHVQPLTGRIAEERLAELAAQGIDAALPEDPSGLVRRAVALREDLRRPEAWEAFERVRGAVPEAPWLGAWVDDSLERFAGRTHRFDALLDLWKATWAHKPSASAAWGLYRVHLRAGDVAGAADWARTGVRDYAGDGPWRHQEEAVGITLLRAGDRAGAVTAFDAAARRGGTAGRRAALLAALTAALGQDADAGLRRLSVVAASDPTQRVAAHYWRARILADLERDATADREAVRTADPTGWYATLLEPPGHRDGRFPDAFHDTVDTVLGRSEAHPPSGYPSGPWFDESAGLQHLADVATRHRDWAGLSAAHALASVGLYDLAGPLVGDLWELARRGRLRGAADDEDLSWRTLVFAARDHHRAARTAHGLWDVDPSARAVSDGWQLGWPVAHERVVWRAAAGADVDPWLVLGLMRQESTYDTGARSRVGARGAMQVMPRTGWLLAALRDDRAFTPADLDDPAVAVAYGVDYLGRLLDRFDGVWPVAVAAYNAGPTQVAQWLPRDPMPVDLWVELIPVRETRDYVRKVGAGYARYLAIYGGADRALVPEMTGLDHGPEVVDF